LILKLYFFLEGEMNFNINNKLGYKLCFKTGNILLLAFALIIFQFTINTVSSNPNLMDVAYGQGNGNGNGGGGGAINQLQQRVTDLEIDTSAQQLVIDANKTASDANTATNSAQQLVIEANKTASDANTATNSAQQLVIDANKTASDANTATNSAQQLVIDANKTASDANTATNSAQQLVIDANKTASDANTATNSAQQLVIDANKTASDANSATNSAQQLVIDANKTASDGNTATNSAQQLVIDTNKTASDANSATNATQQTEIDDNGSAISTNNDNIAVLDAENNDQQLQIDNQQNDITQLKLDTTDLESENATQQLVIDANKTASDANTALLAVHETNFDFISVTNNSQQSSIDANTAASSANSALNSAQQTSITDLQTENANLQQQISALQSGSGRDDVDGVYMVFARDFIENNQHLVDINGVNLFADVNTAPFLFVGDSHDSANLALTVTSQADITNTTLQQVMAELPANIINGTHRLSLSNTLGDSEFEVHITEASNGGNTTFPEDHNGVNWEQFTDAPWDPRNQFNALVFDNKIWVMQGYIEEGSENQAEDIWYTSDGENWTEVPQNPTMPSKRERPAAVVFNGRMYVMGGKANGGLLNDVYSSEDGENWTLETASAPWSPRVNFNVVTFDGKMWIAGGLVGASGINDVWSSTDGANWTQVTGSAPWSGRYGHVLSAFNNKLYVINGLSPDVWSSTDGASWTQETGNTQFANGFRYGPASVVYDNKMWIIAGQDGNNGVFDEVYNSSNGATWTLVTDTPPWSARSHFQAVVFQGRIWVIGGYRGGPAPYLLNDVWATTD